MSVGQYETCKEATEIFRTFTDGAPDLIDIGIPAIREEIGGFFKGTLIGIAMATGVGKTNLVLSMLMNAAHRGGMISTEDPADVLGARCLSWKTGISSLDIRRKRLTSDQKVDIQDALAEMREDPAGPRFSVSIGARLEDVEAAVEDLALDGCRFVVLDYLQKVRGGGDDRRNEVGRVMTTFQRACDRAGVVPIMVSQLVRMERTKAPQVHHLKESGDIENECRVILLGNIDPDDEARVCIRTAKSTFGGAGLRFSYRYDDAGVLAYEEVK